MPSRVHGFPYGGGDEEQWVAKGGSRTAEPIPVARRHPREKRSPRQFVRYFYADIGTGDEAALTTLLFRNPFWSRKVAWLPRSNDFRLR